jgi:hypothetical protein
MNTSQWLASASRTPLISRDQRNRVVSTTDGQWIAQHFRGRMMRGDIEIRDKYRDPWINAHRPTDKVTALGQAMPHQDDRP